MQVALPITRAEDLHGKRVLVFGLGTKGGGVEVVKWLVKHGAAVTVTDQKRADELQSSLTQLRGLPVTRALGGHRVSDVDAAELVVRNPAVPLDSAMLQRAREKRIPVVMDTTLFFLLCPAPIAGITGTRGKSTTTAVAGEILRRSQPDTVVAGNIQRSPLADLDAILPDTPVVLELSSWQLEGIEPLQRSPHLAVLTTILPDHLNRYPNMEAYVAAKETIVKYQEDQDVAILPLDEPWGERFAGKTPAQRRWFGAFSDITVLRNTVISFKGNPVGLFRVGDGLVQLQERGEETILRWDEVGGTGDHTKRNMLAGALLALEMGAPLDDVRAVLTMFRGLPNRLELIRELESRTFVNDTTATTPEAVVAALRAYPSQQVVLITGGTDKNLDYTTMAAALMHAPNLRSVVLLAGSATEKFRRAYRHCEERGDEAISYSHELAKRSLRFARDDRLVPVQTMGEAVQLAWAVSQPGDVIVLSPGAASFEFFRDEFDRGAQFRDAVTALPTARS